MNNIKLAIVGLARTGKNTVADMIRLHSQEHIMQLAFGDALKTEMFRMFPNLPKDPKPRDEMIKFGQAMRDIQPNIWIEKLDECYKTYVEYGIQHFIITDVRQYNEYLWCKENGFTMVLVHAPVDVRKERSGNEVFHDVSETESEIHRIPANYKLYNHFGRDHLEGQIQKMLQRMGIEQCR